MRSAFSEFPVWLSAGVLLVLLHLPASLAAQEAQPPPPADDDGIILNFPENVELKVLIDYVARRLGLNILYDEEVANRPITIKAPARIPRDSLPGLLESILKIKGLAIVDAEQPGWKQIVPADNLAAIARPPAEGPPPDPEAAGPNTVLTQVFALRHADARRLEPVLKPFLTQPAVVAPRGAAAATRARLLAQAGGSIQTIPEENLLIVTDYAPSVRRIAELIRFIDQPRRDSSIEFIPVKHADPSQLADRVMQLLSAKFRSQTGADAQVLEATYDARSNQIMLIGSAAAIEEARQILASLDVPVPSEQSPVRFFKLANATAAEVLATIRSLEEEQDQFDSASPGRERQLGYPAGAPPSPQPGTPVPRPARTAPGASVPAGRDAAEDGDAAIPSPGTSLPPPPSSPSLSREVLRTRNARVTADPHTNTIIIVAEPSVQRIYEQLIRQLDKRRPQVLIEATIVTLDTSDDFSLGVEIGVEGGTEDNQIITFSSFGLSQVNARTGRLAITPGTGFNGTLLSSDIADVVVRALASSRRAKVVSAPRILVNDNSSGVLASIAEFPFTSVNASDTVATTSFGGYAEAGTTIHLTPHISESDYLQLEYAIALNSFTGQGVNGIPPPRKTDSVQSRVTIPDGSTIVVGGLNRTDESSRKDAIPLLGDLPILEYLFSSRTRSRDNSTLFVFIRPVILRDDAFQDLKFLSEGQARAAGLPNDLPESSPVIIR